MLAYVIFLVLFVVMWIVLIVPRQREMRRHQGLMKTLSPGDEVMMGAGVYGIIHSIDDDFVMLDVADGVRLKIAKRAVAAKVEPLVPTELGSDTAADEAVATESSDSPGA